MAEAFENNSTNSVFQDFELEKSTWGSGKFCPCELACRTPDDRQPRPAASRGAGHQELPCPSRLRSDSICLIPQPAESPRGQGPRKGRRRCALSNGASLVSSAVHLIPQAGTEPLSNTDNLDFLNYPPTPPSAPRTLVLII